MELTRETEITAEQRQALGLTAEEDASITTVGALLDSRATVAKRLGDTQAALRNPAERTEDYDISGLQLPEGVDASEVKAIMTGAKKAGLSQEAFVNNYAPARIAQMESDRKAWAEEAAKAVGGEEELAKLQNQCRAIGDKELTLTGLDTATLNTLRTFASKAAETGLIPPTDSDPAKPAEGTLSMKVLGEDGTEKTLSFDPLDYESRKQFSLAKVKGADGKEVFVSQHPKYRNEHMRLVNQAAAKAHEASLNRAG